MGCAHCLRRDTLLNITLIFTNDYLWHFCKEPIFFLGGGGGQYPQPVGTGGARMRTLKNIRGKVHKRVWIRTGVFGSNGSKKLSSGVVLHLVLTHNWPENEAAVTLSTPIPLEVTILHCSELRTKQC